MKATEDINIRSVEPLITPRQLKEKLPMSERANEVVVKGREEIKNVLNHEDPRLMVVVGPCSIHDEKVALEYAERLAALSKRVSDRLLVLMRVYFEKPRTTIGWKGLINDPHMDGTFDIAYGLTKGREILLKVSEMGLPVASEMLDPITPQYNADLISWASIGARTTESQTHRQMASGLSMPVGYKNATDGSCQIAIDAIEAARHPHAFLGIDVDGQTCVVNTIGNLWGHLILRGGRSGPNYDAASVDAATKQMEKSGLTPNIIIDCSHANSNKDYSRQCEVFGSIIDQRLSGNRNIVGSMIESNLHEGNQALRKPEDLKYGVSITDACVSWETTEMLLLQAHKQLAGLAEMAGSPK